MRDLTCAFNHMTARVQRAALRQHEFVSGATHELRPSLTALLLRLEILVAHPPALQDLPCQIEVLLVPLPRLWRHRPTGQLLLLAGIDGRRRVFDRFRCSRQARSNTPRHGLGLTIVRELVHLNGDTIGPEAPPGQGDCFRAPFSRQGLCQSSFG